MNRIQGSQGQVEHLLTVLRAMVSSVVEYPDDVSVDWSVMHGNLVVGVRVAPSDMGLVLGRGGSTADAIRQVLWAACRKTDLKIEVIFSTSGQEAWNINKRR